MTERYVVLCLHLIIPQSVKLASTASCLETRPTRTHSSGTQTHAQSKPNADSKVCAGDKKDKGKKCWRGGCGQPEGGRETERRKHNVLVTAKQNITITFHGNVSLRTWTWICVTRQHLYGWQGEQIVRVGYEERTELRSWRVSESWPGEMGKKNK